MHLPFIALALLLLPAPASALCRCVCVQGVSRPICGPNELMRPICQDLCLENVRPEPVVRPLAGGRPVFDPVRPFNPAPGQLAEPTQDLNLDANGQLLGTPSLLSGGVPSSLSGGGSTGVPSGVSGSLGR